MLHLLYHLLLWFQSKPRGLATSWRCTQCGFDVWEEPTQHCSLRHDWKTAVLQCDICEHQDVICDDFRDHMKIKHQVDVGTDGQINKFIRRGVGAFKKLLFCRECCWRNSSESKLRFHKRQNHLTPPSATTLSAGSQTGNGNLNRPAVVTKTAEPKAETGPSGERHGGASLAQASVQNSKLEPYIQGDEDCNNLDVMRDRHIEFISWVQGDFMPTGPNVRFLRAKLYVDREPSPGTYELIPDRGGEKWKIDIVYHYMDPRRFTRDSRYTEWNHEGYPYELYMTTTQYQPATVPIIIYMSAVPPNGYYSLLKTKSQESLARAYVSDSYLFST